MTCGWLMRACCRDSVPVLGMAIHMTSRGFVRLCTGGSGREQMNLTMLQQQPLRRETLKIALILLYLELTVRSEVIEKKVM